jgi:hypothetical protein
MAFASHRGYSKISEQMQKSASQIADEVVLFSQLDMLRKVASGEDLEKDAAFNRGMGAQIVHALKRLLTRVADQEAAEKAITSLENHMRRLARDGKMNTLPDRWYRTITNKDGEVVGYLCGRKAELSTVLSKDMVPQGTRI